MQSFEVIFYQKDNGEEPVKEFILTLDVKMRAKVARSISILERNGTKLQEPFSKYSGNGIFELRISFSSDISRIFYFFFSGKRIILTNGFIKKTQKTPQSEIDKAIRYKKDYIDRRNNIPMETKFDDFLKEQMIDPDFRKEYEALEDNDMFLQSVIDFQNKQYLTQTA